MKPFNYRENPDGELEKEDAQALSADMREAEFLKSREPRNDGFEPGDLKKLGELFSADERIDLKTLQVRHSR